MFASDNGLQFAQYLISRTDLAEEDELLKDLVVYEYNSLQTVIDNEEREVEISFDPNEVIPYLSEGQLPKNILTGNYIITIELGAIAKEEVQSVYHV